MAFVLKKGFESVWRSPPTTASTALTAGEVCGLNSGKATTMVSGDRAYGVFKKDKAASDTTTDPVPVEIIKRGQEYHAPVNTGTFAFTTHVGEVADVDYAGGAEGSVDLTNANSDLVVVNGDATLNEVDVVFINTVY